MGKATGKPEDKRWVLPPELADQRIGGRKTHIFTEYTVKKLANKKTPSEITRGNTLALAITMQECEPIDSIPHDLDCPFGDQVFVLLTLGLRST